MVKIENILAAMTTEEKAALVSGTDFMYTNPIPRLHVPALRMSDGPHGLRVQKEAGDNGVTGSEPATAFPTAVTTASGWNPENLRKMGEAIAEECKYYGVNILLGPGANIKRNPLCGRNFEYFSEDPLLAGKLAAAEIQGVQSQGVGVSMKHFALNDQEGNRNCMVATWSNEQAIREIYLKPFEMSVKDADCHAVMSSFNYIGNRWAGGCSELLQNVLRGEWGFLGFVETDYFGVYGYMTADQAVRNGGDLMLCTTGNDYNNVTVLTNSSKQAMRTSAKNILYTVVNSRAYEAENLNPGMAKWKIVLIGADVVAALLIVGLEYTAIKNYKKRKEEEEEV